MRQLVNMRLPKELLRRVDEVAGNRGRTDYVIKALEAALRGPFHHPSDPPSDPPTPYLSTDPRFPRRVPPRAPSRQTAAIARQARLNADRYRNSK
jgi:hypothetical protein